MKVTVKIPRAFSVRDENEPSQKKVESALDEAGFDFNRSGPIQLPWLRNGPKEVKE